MYAARFNNETKRGLKVTRTYNKFVMLTSVSMRRQNFYLQVLVSSLRSDTFGCLVHIATHRLQAREPAVDRLNMMDIGSQQLQAISHIKLRG